MPRRPPPSALLLHTGPMPNRAHPKHILPLPPLPIKCSQSRSKTAARLTARTNSHLPPQVQRQVLDFDNTGLGLGTVPVMGLHANDSTSSLYSLNSNGSYPSLGMGGRSRSGSGATTPSSSSPVEVTIRGPWDHSQFSLSESYIDSLVPPPKPVVPNPTPLW